MILLLLNFLRKRRKRWWRRTTSKRRRSRLSDAEIKHAEIGHVSAETLCRDFYRTERKEINSGSQEQLWGKIGVSRANVQCLLKIQLTHAFYRQGLLLIGNTLPS
jgi:hypothetical protein